MLKVHSKTSKTPKTQKKQKLKKKKNTCSGPQTILFTHFPWAAKHVFTHVLRCFWTPKRLCKPDHVQPHARAPISVRVVSACHVPRPLVQMTSLVEYWFELRSPQRRHLHCRPPNLTHLPGQSTALVIVVTFSCLAFWACALPSDGRAWRGHTRGSTVEETLADTAPTPFE